MLEKVKLKINSRPVDKKRIKKHTAALACSSVLSGALYITMYQYMFTPECDKYSNIFKYSYNFLYKYGWTFICVKKLQIIQTLICECVKV